NGDCTEHCRSPSRYASTLETGHPRISIEIMGAAHNHLRTPAPFVDYCVICGLLRRTFQSRSWSASIKPCRRECGLEHCVKVLGQSTTMELLRPQLGYPLVSFSAKKLRA